MKSVVVEFFMCEQGYVFLCAAGIMSSMILTMLILTDDMMGRTQKVVFGALTLFAAMWLQMFLIDPQPDPKNIQILMLADAVLFLLGVNYMDAQVEKPIPNLKSGSKLRNTDLPFKKRKDSGISR